MWSSTKKLSSRIVTRLKRKGNHNHDDESSSVPTVQVIANTRSCRRDTSADSEKLPMLYLVAKQWAWPAVEHRAQTHPEEASAEYRDVSGDTCLHWACFGNAPLETVTALLEACPELAISPNYQGALPLHVACSYRASSQVIRALVRAYPDGACARDRSGSFPLHMLCDYGSSLDSMRAVLQTKQGMSTLDAIDGVYHRKSLVLLNARKNMGNFHHDIQILRRARARGIIHGNDHDACEHTPALRSMEFFRKASLLVWLEYNKLHDTVALDSLDNGETDLAMETNIVHACVGLGTCPLSVLTFAMLLYPNQLLVPDSTNGQLPLHLAALQRDTCRLLDVLSSSPRIAASVFDKHGNLPVMLAIQSGQSWSDGVGVLLAANPAALEAFYVDDSLYPYIWSKLLRLPNGGPSCLYESLRAKPSIVKAACSA